MYEIQITGELHDTNEQVTVGVMELDGLSVQLSINEDGDQPLWRCTGCGEESQEDVRPEPGQCDYTGEYIDCDEHVLDEDGDYESCDGSGEIEVHDWTEVPFNWCNSAGIKVKQDRVIVAISVGDPRGAFVMEVERHDDGLYLSVPHAAMSSPHEQVTERSPGWFKIG